MVFSYHQTDKFIMAKNTIITLLFLFSVAATVIAQEEKHCYTTEVYNKRVAEHPEVLQQQAQLEQHIRNYSGVHSTERTSGTVYIIPIVFHIIHNYGPENIPAAQIYDQVRILNNDFRFRSYDTAAVVPAFKNIAADCEIEFRLATIDPNGNCTDGIDRIVSPLTVGADDNAKLNPWPDDRYLNIWVVSSLLWSGAAAYAYYPGTAPPGADGVISIHTYIGSIGTGVVGRSRVLTHEIGHCLNLAHVWGSTNNPGVACGDDGVSDTPITLGWTSCNIQGATCGNVVDNVQNYMEYSYCCNMFSGGQSTRMRATLNSSVGGRNNLWTAANLLATGTDGASVQICSPVADFKCDHQYICAGTTVHFSDLTWHGAPTLWSWNFPGGTPSSSSDQMPVIQYNTAGTYDVILNAINATGADSATRIAYIHVSGAATQALPFAESFELSNSFPGADGFIINAGGGNAWERVTTAGATGVASIKMNNYSGNAARETDGYVTSSFDLSNITQPTLSFKVAYAQQDTSLKDNLKIYVSTNCGVSWLLRWSKSGQTLATTSQHFNSFTPMSSEWRQENVSIVPFSNKANVRFKFENVSAAGNNIYVDDININGTISGIEENYFADGLDVYPNPSSGKIYVEFSLHVSSHVTITLCDALGRTVNVFADEKFAKGNYHFSNEKELTPGIYFVTLSGEQQQAVKRVVVKE
jgi:PKD repeat protein